MGRTSVAAKLCFTTGRVSSLSSGPTSDRAGRSDRGRLEVVVDDLNALDSDMVASPHLPPRACRDHQTSYLLPVTHGYLVSRISKQTGHLPTRPCCWNNSGESCGAVRNAEGGRRIGHCEEHLFSVRKSQRLVTDTRLCLA